MKYRIKNGSRDWKLADSNKTLWKFQNVFFIFRRRDNSENLPVAYLKGGYKSESSLMTCEAELHGWVSRMAYSILSLKGSYVHDVINTFYNLFNKIVMNY